MMHLAVLHKAEVTTLQKANEAASSRRKRQKKRIQRHGMLSIQEGQDLINIASSNCQMLEDLQQNGTRETQAIRGLRRRRKCGEAGHNIRTCQKEA